MLAKAGSPMSQPDSPLPLRNIKKSFTVNCKLIEPPCMVMRLQKHLHRIGVRDSPFFATRVKWMVTNSGTALLFLVGNP
ncbi:hypothetical protein TNCV_4109821 [Trichonephila clavipes]|nr:hypothetical protein TNCV_4109821 [Trichonephila clavipes]